MFYWTKEWLLKFNKSKCKVLHLGKNNPDFEYFIGDENEKVKLMPNSSEKDLGVYIDPHLTFELHINETVKKCRSKSTMILRNITYKTSDILVPLFKSVIRPILESVCQYCLVSPQKERYRQIRKNST